MKKYLIGLVLIASSCAYGQNTNQFGSPVGTYCAGGPQTITDISATPAQQYVCAGSDGHTWTAVGGGNPTSGQVLLSQIPTSGLIGLYTHSDCTNPYKDYSGNGNDGAAISGVTQPTCLANGENFAPINTSTKVAWALPAAVSSAGVTYAFSILPIISNTNSASNGAGFQSVMSSDSSSGGILGLYGNTSAPLGDAWQMAMGTQAAFTKTSSLAFTPAGSVVSYYIGSGAGDLDQLFVNGTEEPYTTRGFTTLTSFGVGNLDVGGGASSGANAFYGVQSVIAVYNRKLTVSEQVQLSSALQSFTQHRTSLMFPFPLATDTVSKVVCNGDSITFGQGVANSWCTLALFSPGETVSIAKPAATQGKYLMAMASRGAQEMIPYYSVNAPRNTGYIFGGTNDMNLTSGPKQSAVTTWNAGIRAIRNSRWGNAKIVFLPMLSLSGAGNDALKDTFDGLINSQCQLYADYCVAPDDPLLYADGAYANATYFQGDGIHPTTAGQTLIATYAANAYKQLYGSTLAAPTQVSTSTYTVLASDNYITVTANSAITLYNCLGYSRFVHIKVLPGLTVTVLNATAAQTIDGVDHSSSALALTAGNNYTFQVVPGAPSTGGCTWIIN